MGGTNEARPVALVAVRDGSWQAERVVGADNLLSAVPPLISDLVAMLHSSEPPPSSSISHGPASAYMLSPPRLRLSRAPPHRALSLFFTGYRGCSEPHNPQRASYHTKFIRLGVGTGVSFLCVSLPFGATSREEL